MQNPDNKNYIQHADLKDPGKDQTSAQIACLERSIYMLTEKINKQQQFSFLSHKFCKKNT